MSWDIFIQDLPKEADKISDIPDDFVPQTIGTRDDIITRIKKVAPNCDFSDKSWGRLYGNGFSIEFNIGSETEINGFACHIRGTSPEVIDVIEKILNELNLKALDPSQDNFFNRDDAKGSFEKWQEYRDKAAENRR